MKKEPETYEELIRMKRCIELTKYYELSEKELEQIYDFLENNKKLVDTIVPVLVEGKNTNGKDGLYGYTDTNKLINFDGDESLTGKIISIQVTSAKTWSLDGKLAE